MKAQFVIKGQIKTKQRPKATTIGGHARVYTPKDTIVYENYIKTCYQTQCDGIYFQDSPLVVNMLVLFKAPKDKEKYLDYGLKCTGHKDLDNVAKIVLDALNKVAFNDDKQVYSLSMIKRYTSDIEEIRVEITSVQGTLEEAKETRKINILYKEYARLKELEKRTAKEQKKMNDLEDKLIELGVSPQVYESEE